MSPHSFCSCLSTLRSPVRVALVWPMLLSAVTTTVRAITTAASLTVAPIAREWVKRGRKRKISARETSLDGDVTLANDPVLGVNVPVRDIATHERELDLLALARLEPDALEATEHSHRCHVTVGGLCEAEVQLRHSMACDGAGVGHSCLDGVEIVPEVRVATRLDACGWGCCRDGSASGAGDGHTAAHLKGGVRQAKPKLKSNRQIEIVKMPVVYEQALLEVALPCVRVAGVQQRRRVGDRDEVVVALLLGDGVRQVTRRIHISVEDINDAVADLLT